MSRNIVIAFFIVAASFALIAAEDVKDNTIPAEALKVLDAAEKLTVYSLDPQKIGDKNTVRFRSYPVLGTTELSTKDSREQLLAALQKGIKENPGDIAKCFDPRHAIRAVANGKTVDLLVCFRCLQVEVYDSADEKSQKIKTVLVSRSPEPAFDRVLKEANVPLAEKGK
jgi:hypothetical protein